MAVVYLSPIGNSVIPFLNANFAANANGFLSTFLSGTSTPSATYTTSAGSVQNAVSIPLGPDGRMPNEVWLVSGIAYRFQLLDFSGALIPGCTYDGITGQNDPASFGAGVASALTVTALTATTISATTGTFSGALSPAALLDISGASAGQIKFPAAQNPSANVNTLDDYEEGTWTPAITFGGASVGVTYTTQTGTYTKIGRLVICDLLIFLSSKGSSAGQAIITGLPFAPAASVNHAAPFYWTGLATKVTVIGLPTTSSGIALYGAGAAAASLSALADTDFTAATVLRSTVTYFV